MTARLAPCCCAAALLCAAVQLAAPRAAAQSAEGALALEARWAVDARGGGRAVELVAWPQFELQFASGARLYSLGRARFDSRGAPLSGRGSPDGYARATRPAQLGERTDVELRELYLDFELGASALRVGKQQIVWGKADGIQVLDALHPHDFREFAVPELQDSRIPLWALSVERDFGPLGVRAVWLPDPTVHELPQAGASFAPSSPLVLPAFPSTTPLRFLPPRQPRRPLADSDAGLRFSGLWRGWDWTLNYLYQYGDAPVFERRPPAAPGSPLQVQPRYLRTQLLGASFSRGAGDWVVRGELALSPDRTLSVNDPGQRDGLARAAELAYVLGLDWYGLRDTLISAQFSQRRLDRSLEGVARDRTESLATLFVRRQFQGETIELELLALHSINRADGLCRARLRYRVRDGVALWLGADLFYGKRAGLFGQFDARDRWLLGAELRL